jgi:protein-L-isoaspartate(D-aspartate) O-methyltransferase
MVREQVEARGVRDERALDAMRSVPREAFVPDRLRARAYDDAPLPIGERQTISQPYIVGLMAEALRLSPGEKVLEVGAGSGYAAAVMSRIAARVVAIERRPSLVAQAKKAIERCGYGNVEVRHANGTLGAPDEAPFDAISVAAGGPRAPRALLDQLAVGGRLVMPVGKRTGGQELVRVNRTAENRWEEEKLGAVRFVPLVGEQGWEDGGR